MQIDITIISKDHFLILGSQMVTEKKVAWSKLLFFQSPFDCSPESFGWFNNNLLMSVVRSELLYLIGFPLRFTALYN